MRNFLKSSMRYLCLFLKFMMGHRNPEPKLGRIPSLIKCTCPLASTNYQKKEENQPQHDSDDDDDEKEKQTNDQICTMLSEPPALVSSR